MSTGNSNFYFTLYILWLIAAMSKRQMRFFFRYDLWTRISIDLSLSIWLLLLLLLLKINTFLLLFFSCCFFIVFYFLCWFKSVLMTKIYVWWWGLFATLWYSLLNVNTFFMHLLLSSFFYGAAVMCCAVYMHSIFCLPIIKVKKSYKSFRCSRFFSLSLTLYALEYPWMHKFLTLWSRTRVHL